MSDLKLRLEDLTTGQRALLLKRLAQRGAAEPAPAADPAALSFAQERWLFQDQLSPADPAHTIVGALRLRGRLDRDALQQALQLIYSRHQPLRLNFSTGAGGARANERQSPQVHLTHSDLTEPADSTCDGRIHTAYCASVQTGFDLQRDQLIRVDLGQLGINDHLLTFTLHHIVSDGWSLDIFLRELAGAYAALANARQPDLPELTAQYSDYVAWQKRRLSGPALAKSLSYWRDQLDGAPWRTDLAADRPMPASASASTQDQARDLSGATVELRLPRDLVDRLTALAQSEGCSLFTSLLTGYFLLLARLTGQDDLILGIPVSGRLREENEPLIGLFLNTLALRLKLDPATSVRAALQAVNRVVLDGLEHHEVPFDRVVQEVTPSRSTRKQALFDLMFNFTPSPPRSFEMAQLQADFVPPPNQRCAFSAALYVTQWDGRLELRLAYQTARFSQQRMHLLLEQYAAVLRQMVDNIDQNLASLELRVACAKENTSATSGELPDQVPLTRQIADWARRTPDAIALQWQQETLSYRHLAASMQALAGDLARSGAVPGDTIAICAPAGPELVRAMAAVFEFGGVLMTLDPELPPERHAVMIAQAQARCVLYCDRITPETLDWLRARKMLLIPVSDSAHMPGDACFDPNRFSPPSGTTDPAYVFFTSGSTGTPKAVLGTAGGLAHFVSWQRDTFDIKPDDRAAQFTGLSFDVVLRDIFAPLVSGATLVIPPANIGPAQTGAPQWLAEQAITVLHSVPSVLQSWLLAGAALPQLPALRLVFSAGEPLDRDLVQSWQKHIGHTTRLINLYGPTETTLAKFAYEVPAALFEGTQPVGQPLPQSEALILTSTRKPAATGEMGEIAIRTGFRSLGYRNDPEKTAQRFIPTPAARTNDDLVYLTGDLGWLDPAGLLHIAGRMDDQVKISGIRVEPGEISALLEQHSGVAASAVVARRTTGGTTELDAYFVPRPGVSPVPTRAELRSFLRARLPAALVPNGPALLQKLPLTANHKLDRRHLPPIEAEPDLTETQAPASSLELQLLQIWAEVLGKSGFGVTDDFFDIGGHSLLALRLVLVIEQRMGLKIPLAELFKSATVAHLARVAQGALDGAETGGERVVPLWQRGSGPPLWLVHTGGGMLWNYQPLVQALVHEHACDFPIYGFEARGLFDGQEPHNRIADMASEFIAALRQRQPSGPYRLGGHSFGGVVAWEMACQLQAEGADVSQLILFDSSLNRPDDTWQAHQTAARIAARDLAAAVDIFSRFTDTGLALSEESLAKLSLSEQLDQAAQVMASSIGSHEAARQLVAGLLRVSQQHRAARQAYTPGQHSAPVLLFQAQDSDTKDPDIEARQFWAKAAAGPFEAHVVEGDHVTMMAAPYVQGLAKALHRHLPPS